LVLERIEDELEGDPGVNDGIKITAAAVATDQVQHV
jgi:hypothetical protein